MSDDSSAIIRVLSQRYGRECRSILKEGISDIADLYLKRIKGNSYYDICAITGIIIDPNAKSTMKDIKFNTPEEIKGVISKIVISQI